MANPGPRPGNGTTTHKKRRKKPKVEGELRAEGVYEDFVDYEVSPQIGANAIRTLLKSTTQPFLTSIRGTMVLANYGSRWIDECFLTRSSHHKTPERPTWQNSFKRREKSR